jgi:hypothetical protein
VSRVLLILALVLACLGALAIRVVVEGRSALAAGDDWMTRGKPFEAIGSFEAAARWYLPLAPHVDEAYDRLRALTTSEDPAVAIAAWRGIRGAARATRTLWTPHADDLEAADRGIASLSALDPRAANAGDTTREREAWYQARLSRDPRPGTGAVVLAGLGILLWVGGAIALVRRGVDGAGGLLRRPALVAGVTILVGVVCWAVGHYNA